MRYQHKTQRGRTGTGDISIRHRGAGQEQGICSDGTLEKVMGSKMIMVCVCVCVCV